MYFREKTGLFYVCNEGKLILYIACLWQREKKKDLLHILLFKNVQMNHIKSH